MGRFLPEAAPIVEWGQMEPGVTELADGTAFTFARGSEQGETLGGLKAVGPLAGAREQAHASPGLALSDGVQDE